LGLYQNWKASIEGIDTQKDHDAFWKDYLDWEKEVYTEILTDLDVVLEGRISELAERFGTEPERFAGFMDGINDSLKKSYDIEKLKESTPVRLDIDPEKLYFNMLDAKAHWLYNLPQWDDILSKEQRAVIARNHRASKQASSAQIERNGPCPCGSGKKYKKCCG
jgi:uncharacterized protein YecA (UPF0149 family)